MRLGTTVRLCARAALMGAHQRHVRPARDGCRMPRDVRQRAEILATIRAGDLGRALVLATEHLLEFPDDEVVRDALRAAGGEV